MISVIGNEDTTGERKTNIRAPLQCRGQCELFSILMHYVCIRGRDEFSPSSTWTYVSVLDLANSDLHFPCTTCEMFSDVGTVTAIMYKVPPPLLFIRILTPGKMADSKYSCNYQTGDENGNSHLA